MCGIVGLFSKSHGVSDALGLHLSEMLLQLSDRGPDSAGVAFYRDSAPAGSSKVSLFSADPRQDWTAVGEAIGSRPEVHGSHAVFVFDAEAAEAVRWLRERYPELRVMSEGEEIEIYKEAGRPERFIEAFGLPELDGSHALGHTRMATESR